MLLGQVLTVPHEPMIIVFLGKGSGAEPHKTAEQKDVLVHLLKRLFMSRLSHDMNKVIINNLKISEI